MELCASVVVKFSFIPTSLEFSIVFADTNDDYLPRAIAPRKPVYYDDQQSMKSFHNLDFMSHV